MKKNVTSMRDLAKRSGLYYIKCPKCKKRLYAIPAIRNFFKLILDDAIEGKSVRIIGFGRFRISQWEAPKMIKTMRIVNRLFFRPSNKTKKYIAEKIKEKNNAERK
jgi:nucleoid DNA-binding protein